MNDADERLAYLEGRAEEQGRMVDVIRDGMANLSARMAAFDERFASLEARMDRRFEHLEQRMDQRFAGMDARFDSMNKLLWGLIVAVAGGAISILAGIVVAIVTT